MLSRTRTRSRERQRLLDSCYIGDARICDPALLNSGRALEPTIEPKLVPLRSNDLNCA